jgi:predicted Fe-S protein YdhL (DUF1289 family)
MTAETILYPHTEGGWPLCRGCYRHRDDVAHAIDPRTGTLDLLCGDCYRTLAAHSPLPLPAGDERRRIWAHLARLHQNREISDDLAATALGVLAPHLLPVDAWDAFEALKHELLELQAAEDGDVDLLTLEPEWRDAETYVNHLRGLVDDAVNKLTGRA